MLNGGEEDNNSFLFRDGYAETVEARADAGDWEIVADQHVPGWDNQEAQTIMEQILVDADNGVDAVFAANDGLAQASINAMEAAGIGPVPVSGQDATAPGIQNILLGTQTMTVYKPIEAEAAVAAAVALALRDGEDPTAIDVGVRLHHHRHQRRGRVAGRFARRRRRGPVLRPRRRSASPPTTSPTPSSPTGSARSRRSASATSPRRTSARRIDRHDVSR